MQPLALILNIAIVVGIVGIVVYWVRRFAVFLGYKAIEPDVLQIAELLKAQPLRDRSDVVLEGNYGGNPTIVRFSHRVDTPGLDIQMRVPATLNLFLMPKNFATTNEGRVLMRTGSATLDRRFNARTDHPMEFKMLTAGMTMKGSLEQLCCSTQTGLSIRDRTIELSELAIPPFTANHVFDHLQSMLALAKTVQDMPGADLIKVEPLPRRGSSWPIRIALAGGLVCLVALLFTQPYNRMAGASADSNMVTPPSGVAPGDAARMQQLQGWRAAVRDDFSISALRFLREHRLEASGRIAGDFGGRGAAADSAYLLVDTTGRRRVSMLAKGAVAYDAIFPKVDALARISKSSMAKIQWMSSGPPLPPDGDGLLVVQNANDPTASVVLLRHGSQTLSARPADLNKIDLISQ
ncbi:MAG TPA: hypothetical protein VGQ12_01865 [Candidatus Angelobacter sp.]|jgi:hypothetical protein|nr:hypothetical protein [Candidatus Angelobacter sp.]